MGNQIDWTALPIVVEIYGVEDVVLFISQLEAIREHLRMIGENG